MSKIGLENCKITVYRGALVLLGRAIDGISEQGGDKHITISPPHEKDFHKKINKTLDLDIYDLGPACTSTSKFHVIACPQIQYERSKLGLGWTNLHVTTLINVNDDHTADKGPKSLLFKRYTADQCYAVLECLKKHQTILQGAYSKELARFSFELIDQVLQSTDSLELSSFKVYLLFKSKRYQDAVHHAEEILTYHPNHVQTLVYAGDSYYKQGLFENALEAYWKACVNLKQDEEKIAHYLADQLHKLWKKSIVLLECIKEPKLGFTRNEMLIYQTKRNTIYSPTDEIDENHLNQSRNRIVVKGYRMPRFFSWIVPFVLAGMSTPKNKMDIIHLETIGVQRVITLTEEEPLPKEWFSDSRIQHEFWPVSNYYPPAIAHVDAFIKLLVQTIHSDDPGSVLVHCGGGKGRAGSLLACFLVLFGLSVPPKPCIKCEFKPAIRCTDASCAYGQYPKMNAAEAIELIRNLRPGSIETAKQEDFIALFTNTCWGRIGSQAAIYPGVDPNADIPGEIKCTGKINSKPTFIILQGLPASGKSWFSSVLRQNNWIVISQDETGSKDACESQLSRYAKHIGTRIVVDRCNPTKNDILHWKSLAGSPNTVVVSFKASPEICIERAQNRLDHPTIAPGMAKSVICSFAKQMQEISLDSVPTIYNVETFNDSKVLLQHFGIKLVEKQEFYKYPRTRHLMNLGAATRDDLVLSEADTKPFFNPTPGSFVTVEEKIDGANLGFRLDQNGEIVAQNRNHILTDAAHDQFKLLSSWIRQHRRDLMYVLSSERILYGEWTYALHSCSYNKLSDYFIAFDIYDINTNTFLSRKSFDGIISNTSLVSCPRIEVGFPITRATIDQLIAQKSTFSDTTIREGLVFRVDRDVLVDKAKIVRTDFIAGNDHWSKGPLKLNLLE
ncbi:hypothetical protein HDV01_000160 [Terramyces sp. JEL0728]|nr:hypothetical protein HDV01_000160 [Terramyces sp. JEL0728]